VNNQVPLPIGPQNTDGIVVFADSLGDDIIRSLVEKQFPVVLIHRSAPKDCNVPCVTIENKATSRKLVDHLIEDHGRRRIAFLRGPQLQEDSKWREQGYCESLLNHNLAIDPTLILNGEFDRDIARESVLSFFQRSSSDCDAIFCGDDDAAIGVVGALHDLHLNIPGQVSVVGFDDQSISAYLDPPLTTVRAPTEMVGRQAAAVLFGLLSGQSVAPVMLLQTEIVYRRSCGCHELPSIRR
jgi:LacI family transcriptional regulator